MKHSPGSRRRHPVARIMGLAFLALVLAVLVLSLTTALRLRPHLTSALAGLARLQDTLTSNQSDLVSLLRDSGQVTALHSTLTSLKSDLQAIDRIAGPFLPIASRLGWVPLVGGDLQAVHSVLDLAENTTDGALALSDALTPAAARLQQADLGLGQVAPELVRDLVAAEPAIQAAQSSFDLADQARTGIQEEQLSSTLQAMVERFDHYRPLVDQGLQALTALPALLGANKPRTYLVLAQNNQELRATGGFISGVGLVTFQDGKITGLRFQDSYSVDNLNQPHPLPPDALRRTMGAGILVLRDANWWPDFPTSARSLASLYRQDQGVAVDGVIAADLTSLSLLVQALGPVQVPGYDQAVTGENLQAMLMSYWQAPLLSAPGEEGTDWYLHRKDFAADLMSALLGKAMERTPPEGWSSIVRAAGTALRERHLLIYVEDAQVEKILNQMHWDGALYSAGGDYAMVVDSNVGFNKVNSNIEQTIDYQVTLDNSGNVQVQLTLTYQHLFQRPTPACIHEARYGDSYADLMERCYWDYVRIYLPAGSQLVELRGSDAPADVYSESGKTAVGAYFLLPTGEGRQLQVIYRPNLKVQGHQYTLLIQKQPGTESLPLRVSVRLPPGSQLTDISPVGWAWSDGKAVWQGHLAQDMLLTLAWR